MITSTVPLSDINAEWVINMWYGCEKKFYNRVEYKIVPLLYICRYMQTYTLTYTQDILH